MHEKQINQYQFRHLIGYRVQTSIIGMNPNFQLNIDCYKINNWLEQRKKLPKDWQVCLKACDAKIQVLLEEPILKEIHTLAGLVDRNKQNFSYLNVLEVCQKLEGSKLAQEKNFIGKYTNPTLKGWLALRQYMRKNIVGLLHSARLINQLLKFDLPGLKKNKESISNQIVMLKRKIDFNNNSIYHNKMDFANQCKNYGIQGQNIRQEVPKLIEDIPQIFANFQKQCRADDSVLGMMKLYKQFCTVNGSKPSDLALLSYFCNFGDDILDIYTGKLTNEVQQKRVKKYDIYKYNPHKNWEIEVEENNQKPERLQTILSDRPSRLQIINSLNQLYYFYQVLQQQLRSGDTHLLSTDYLKIQPPQQLLSSYIGKLSKLLALINDASLNQLIGMYQNPQSSHRICQKLQLYGTTIRRFTQDVQRLTDKIIELEQVREKTSVQIQQNKELLQKVHKLAEQELSAMMKREVRLVGDINKIEIDY